MAEAILNDESPETVEVEGRIEQLSENFLKWLKDNENRIAEAESRETLPYFLQDNGKMQDGKWVENYQKFIGIAEGSETHKVHSSSQKSEGKFVDIDTDEITKKLRELSENFSHEEAYIGLSDGRVYHKIGNRVGVNFSEQEKSMFEQGVRFHNHNRETLSVNDIAFLYTQKLKSIRAITMDAVYIAFAPTNYEQYSYKHIIDNLSIKAVNNLQAKLAKMNSKEIDKARKNLQELEIVELCKILRIRYSKVTSKK